MGSKTGYKGCITVSSERYIISDFGRERAYGVDSFGVGKFRVKFRISLGSTI